MADTTNLAHLQESEEKYQSLFAAISDAIIVFDRETRVVTETNDIARQLYGYSSKEFQEMQVDFLEVGRLAVSDHSVGSVGKSKGQLTARLHRRKDGACFPVEVVEGNYQWKYRVHGFIICRNNTELRLLEDQSLQARRDWEETFDTIPDAITIHNASYVIVRANKAAREQFDIPEQQGQSCCHTHYHTSSCPQESCLVKEAISKKGPVSAEFYLDHREKHYEFNVIPRFGSEGEFLGTIHMVRDLTERRKLEEQLFHSQKMASIGTLAGGIAHDFNNILTVIMATCSLIEMEIGTDDQVRGGLRTVVDAAKRAATLTGSLLAFSRKQIFNPKQVDISSVVRKMESFLRRVLGEDIELVISCPSCQLNMMADPMQLEQVFMNLAVNAKDAMPEGGTLIIDLAPVLVTAQMAENMGCAPGGYAEITVSDSGCGMNEKTMERIFDPYFTTKEVGKGTGLGLSIVYGVINQHGGLIRTSSEVGEGTTFSIYLPLEWCKPADPLNEKPCMLRGSETILLAEDDAAVRGITTAILRECGYAVIPAVDGEDALHRFTIHKGRIDLVMFDVIMPRMNGKKACDAIREIDPDVPVLFTSGYTDATIHRDAIAKRGLQFISKPTSIEALTHKVRELLDVPARQGL